VTFAVVVALYAVLGTALILTLRAMAARWRAADAGAEESDVPYGPAPEVPADVASESAL
jgi:hypothetical protein